MTTNLASKELADFEGLVYATAARYEPFLDDDHDDIAQALRIKVWQALNAYDPSRSSMSVENYVFSCVRNRMKDMFKSQDRRNRVRGGVQLHIDDVAGEGDAFHTRYLSESADEVYAIVEDEALPLPSTLTGLEQAVVALLLLDFNQTEIAARLGASRVSIRRIEASVREKLADWRPGSGPPERAERPVLAA